MPPQPETGKPEATVLAKTYLWLSAARQSTDNPQHSLSIGKMLDQTLAIMPASWTADLDQKVNQHLSKHP